MTSSASISSVIRIAPISGDEPGADLRRHHVAERVGHDLAQVAPGAEDAGVGRAPDRAVEVGALDPALQAEDERQAQMIIVEPTIRMPAWRSASPKKRNTRSPKTSPNTRAENLAMSPSEAIQSRGAARTAAAFQATRHLITEISGGWRAASG